MKLRTTKIVLLALLASSPALAQDRLRMSTTTSTENSGLLKVLLPPFEKQCNCHVDVISVGTGKALKLGETGDVDVSATGRNDAPSNVGTAEVVEADWVIIQVKARVLLPILRIAQG